MWDIKAVQWETFIRIQPNPGTENYAMKHHPVRVVAGLRMGDLPLEVETGRYMGTAYQWGLILSVKWDRGPPGPHIFYRDTCELV